MSREYNHAWIDESGKVESRALKPYKNMDDRVFGVVNYWDTTGANVTIPASSDGETNLQPVAIPFSDMVHTDFNRDLTAMEDDGEIIYNGSGGLVQVTVEVGFNNSTNHSIIWAVAINGIVTEGRAISPRNGVVTLHWGQDAETGDAFTLLVGNLSAPSIMTVYSFRIWIDG